MIIEKGGENMKGNLFIRTLLIIIVVLLALNIVLPILSNPMSSYAVRPIQYKVSEIDNKKTEDIEKILNEYSKEGWELDTVGTSVMLGLIVIFKK
jgi:hypothetical protein